jgi:CRP/FNR family transcriptional regulator
MDERIAFKNKFEEKIKHKRENSSDKDLIVKKGQNYEDVYVIDRGHVKVVEKNDDGNERVLLILKRGEAFPLIWAFDDPCETVYDYVSIGETSMLKCSLLDFKHALSSDSAFTKASMEMFVHLTWDALERIKSLQMPFTYEKLLRLLPYVATKIGNKISEHEFKIPNSFTQQDMANLLGTSRESISAHFQKAVSKGIIRKSTGGKIFNLKEVPSSFIYTRWFKEN